MNTSNIFPRNLFDNSDMRVQNFPKVTTECTIEKLIYSKQTSIAYGKLNLGSETFSVRGLIYIVIKTRL